MITMTPLSAVLRGTTTGGGATTTGKPPPPSIHRHFSLGRDDGALRMLRHHYPCLSEHRNIQELGDNLVKAFEQEPGSHPSFHAASGILGHGDAGYVEVGAGQWGGSWDRSIFLENEEVWGPQFARLRAPPRIERHPYWGQIPHFRVIHFLSCSTAAGEGRKLLQRIADIGNLRVSAITGLLFVTPAFTFWEKGANVACCVPQDTPRPNGYVHCSENDWREPSGIPDPSLQFVNMKGIGFGPGMEPEDIESISVKTPSTEKEFVLPKEVAAEFFRRIFSSPPYENDGALTAAHTARIELKFRSQPAIYVNLLADRLAETERHGVFLVAKGIRAYFAQLGIP